jgi:hypothetical protein
MVTPETIFVLKILVTIVPSFHQGNLEGFDDSEKRTIRGYLPVPSGINGR